jgi:pilus assembly protein CpaB
MGRRTLLLIASILVAALGTSLVWLYVQGAESRAQQGQGLVPVLTFSGQALAGTRAENLGRVVTQKHVPADVAAGAVTSLDQVKGQQLVDTAVPGQLLLTGMFSAGTASGIQNGRAFVSISIAEPDRAPALLKVGDDVAVYVRGTGAAGSTALVVPRVRVLTLGAATPAGQGSGQSVPVAIVGFDVSAEEGAKIVALPGAGTPVLEILGEGTKAVNPRLP